jgi:hypothetical protein
LFFIQQFSIESDIAQEDNFEGISKGGTEVLLGDPLLKADNRYEHEEKKFILKVSSIL